MNADLFKYNCTGDACEGDVILFTETVWGGSYRKPYRVGERTIAARIVRDSYGSAKQQHTFTLDVIWSDGTEPLPVGVQTRRKGRNVYRNGTCRLAWPDESQRETVLADKHRRGAAARNARAMRRALAY
jgi:hypothetical protein